MKRTLFDKPIRGETTGFVYRDKITLEEFREHVKNSVDVFCDNIIRLKKIDPAYIEEWYQTFLAYNEVEQE